MDTLRGHLLIAGASLWDPNFRRSVVLIGHHDDEGAVGVVLNQPLETTVEEAAPPLSALVPPGERQLFFNRDLRGDVKPSILSALMRSPRCWVRRLR